MVSNLIEPNTTSICFIKYYLGSVFFSQTAGRMGFFFINKYNVAQSYFMCIYVVLESVWFERPTQVRNQQNKENVTAALVLFIQSCLFEDFRICHDFNERLVSVLLH